MNGHSVADLKAPESWLSHWHCLAAWHLKFNFKLKSFKFSLGRDSLRLSTITV